MVYYGQGVEFSIDDGSPLVMVSQHCVRVTKALVRTSCNTGTVLVLSSEIQRETKPFT
jgi:hypothetical protein